MDIAYYISDLLGQQGELTVPNLGYFVQIRMPAYYDSQVKKFFPPHYSVQFDPQIIDDDDALANHITALKKISIASAKYFIEKYISNLKSQAVVESVAFANLGTFSSDGTRLTFNTNTKTDDPTFFAYPPVDAAKIGESPLKRTEPIAPVVSEVIISEPAAVSIAQQPITTPVTPFVTEPIVDEPVAKPFFGSGYVDVPGAEQANTEEETYEEEEPKRLGVWMIVLIVFTLLIIGLGALYKFKPWLFQKQAITNNASPAVVPSKPVPVQKDTPADSIAKQTAAQKDSLKADTVKTTTHPPVNKKPDAIVKPVATATTPPAKTPVTEPAVTAPITPGTMPDIVPKGAWVIYSGAYPVKSGATGRVAELNKKGFTQARLLTDKVSRGGNYKVILGVYNNNQEAQDAKKEFLASGKLKEDDLSVGQNKKSLE